VQPVEVGASLLVCADYLSIDHAVERVEPNATDPHMNLQAVAVVLDLITRPWAAAIGNEFSSLIMRGYRSVR
jgi:hypothetical protein